MGMVREYLPSLNQEMFLRNGAFSSAHFHVPVCLVLAESPDPVRLHDAFARCIAKHGLLRTRFRAPSIPGAFASDHQPATGASVRERLGDSTFRQHVYDTASVSIEQYPVHGRVTATGVRDAAREHCHRLFDPECPPAARMLLIEIPGEQPLLQIVVHHLVADGWSIGTLIKDLNEAYKTQEGDEATGAEGLTFGDFAHWERKQIEGQHWDRSIDYWRRQWLRFGESLIGPEQLHIAEPITSASLDAAEEVSKFDDEFVTRLRSFCGAFRVTPYVVLLTALFALLHRLTGGTRLAVLAHFVNRSGRTAHLVGPLSNQHVLGIECSPDMTLGQLLQHVRETVLEAIAHQIVPAPVIAEMFEQTFFTQPRPLPTYTPIACDAVRLGGAGGGPGDLVRGSTRSFVPPSDHVWRIRLRATREGAWLSMLWPRDRLRREHAIRMLQQLLRACHDLVDHHGVRISDLPQGH